MFYLWESKNSKPKNRVFYITNYKEIKDGKVKIDNHGWIPLTDVKLVYESEKKVNLIAYAQNLDL